MLIGHFTFFFIKKLKTIVLVIFSFSKINNNKKNRHLNSDKSELVLYRNKSVLSKL